MADSPSPSRALPKHARFALADELLEAPSQFSTPRVTVSQWVEPTSPRAQYDEDPAERAARLLAAGKTPGGSAHRSGEVTPKRWGGRRAASAAARTEHDPAFTRPQGGFGMYTFLLLKSYPSPGCRCFQ